MRSYVALRNVYVLVCAVMFFVGSVLGARPKLRLIFKKLCDKARRFTHVPCFLHYAIADGIHCVLIGARPHFERSAGEPSAQLCFAFARPPNA